MVILTLTTGIALPVVALLTIVLVPFSDRKARIQMGVTYFSYLGAVLYLAGLLA